MDALDRLEGPARELLSRVDDVLTRSGAPADHPLWPLLRELRVLPGDAVASVAALRPAPLAAAGPALRALSNEYAELHATPPDWHGPAAEAFAARWATVAGHVEEGLAGRLSQTASYAEAVADWLERTRRAVARTLATVMTSAQAVTLVTSAEPDAGVRAAADIGARVLGTVADAYGQADLLLAAWSGRLGELAFAPPAVPATAPGSLDVPLG